MIFWIFKHNRNWQILILSCLEHNGLHLILPLQYPNVQFLFCRSDPGQYCPPLVGGGLEQVLRRCWLQSGLHADQSDHDDQPPWISVKKQQTNVMKILCYQIKILPLDRIAIFCCTNALSSHMFFGLFISDYTQSCGHELHKLSIFSWQPKIEKCI